MAKQSQVLAAEDAQEKAALMTFVGRQDQANRDQIAVIAIEWRRVFGADETVARAHLRRLTGKTSRLDLTVDEASGYIDWLRREASR